MSLTADYPVAPIVSHQPDVNASLDDWVHWFWASFLPEWIERAHDQDKIGFFDLLDKDGQPVQSNRRTLLAQARLLFTFSHLALISENPAFHKASRIAWEALSAFRKSPGVYCAARLANGEATSDLGDNLARSYDLSFVILGLSTWGRLQSDISVEVELEACWFAVENPLRDKETGLMLEHERVFYPKAHSAPNRAQNPHMHLYEASLQAYEMTGNQTWLERAARMRAKGLEYFFDNDSGTIIEFIAPDLSALEGREGQRREIGHQCEWAWLLMREAELSGNPSTLDIANRLLAFADQNGFACEGPLAGAAFDAVAADLSWREESFLLWPQTEAIKTYAVRAHEGDYGSKARELALLMFKQYFAGRSVYINQVDNRGEVIWSDALSRLHYHTVLSLTEGARAGLWQKPV